jgi:N-dimethylarginine dimethylaminohydrolase
MQERLLIRTPSDASASNLSPDMAPRLPRRKRVLLADPAHFRIEYAINPHMRTEGGELHKIDPKRAAQQWESVREAYESLNVKTEVLAADPRYPDLVFAANQSFPYTDPHSETSSGKYCFVPSRMAHPERAGEVPIVSEWLLRQGYRETPLTIPKGTFEGTGDLTWFGNKRLLVGGIGKRTSIEGLRAVADLIESPMIVLEMDDPDFYHLDTCLTFLDDTTAMWVPHAFKNTSQKLLSSMVETLIEVDDLEARRGLACNAHSPNGRTVIIHKDNTETIKDLENLGYDVLEVDTSEFNKSGGSVFCLKLSMW